MKILIILLGLSLNTFAVLKVENQKVQPSEIKGMKLSEFITFYADTFNISITYEDRVVKDVDINLVLNKELDKEEMTSLFDTVLMDNKLTKVENGVGFSIIETRDVRYTPVGTYSSENNPGGKQYIMVHHKMKFALSSEASRNIRPFLSRYGRVIDFADGKTIVLLDYADNIKRLISIISSIDNKNSFQSFLNKRQIKKRQDSEFLKLQEEVVGLKLEKKILEKKYIEKVER